jgi:hypothetical protein
MRVHRSLQILTALTTLAVLTACSSMGRQGRSDSDPAYSSTTVAWDSGPLDRDYKSQRSDMDTRHAQEVANPRAGESSDQAQQRQKSENDDLDSRYAKGKAAHSQTVPPGDQQAHANGQADKPHQ